MSIRVAVTGLGAVTALGPDREETWRRLVAGESGITRIRAWETSAYETDHAGEATAFEPARHFEPKRLRRLDRCHQLSIVAAREAMADAGLEPGSTDPARAGIVIGSSLGGMPSWQRFDRELAARGRARGRLVYEYPLHVCLDRLTEELGFLGPRAVTSTACTASTVAVGYALDLVRSGQADLVLTGGVDPLAEFSFAGFSSMKNVAPVACAPFSEPIGLTTGEAAAMIVVEPLERALARGARVWAELVGYALTADAYHPTSGDPTGGSQKRAIVEALERSGVDPDEVDYVNAHGTGTAGNDRIESMILSTIFGADGRRPPVSSSKGALGHTLGAAGGVEALITAMAVDRDVVPPTANFTEPRPGLAIDPVPNESREQPVRVAVSQNFAFGGNNAALVLREPDPESPQPPAPPRRRVVLTGVGPITPIGSGADEFLEGLRGARSGVGPIETFELDGLSPRVGATVADFDPSTFTGARTRRMDRFGQFTLCAAELAFDDSGIELTRDNAGRIGIVVGTTVGSMSSVKAFHSALAAGRPERANPGFFPNTVMNAGAGLAAIHLRVKGCNVALSVGQASGLAAVGYAFHHVATGGADMVLAGGVEELDRAMLEGFSAAIRTPPHLGHEPVDEPASVPFGRRRSGMVLGEGGAMVAVESLESAAARGAPVYGEILGYHTGADRPVELGWDPSGEGLARCMRTALDSAGVAPSEVDLVAAGALSHPLHDAIEARAVTGLFGPRGVPVAALSSSLGGSAVTGAASLCAAARGMRDGFLPCGVALDDPDPAFELDLVAGAPRPGGPAVALINAVSYGGSNVSLVIGTLTDD